MSLPDVTWPLLLARWVAFARASLALPRDADGDRWREAVPAIIGLQAVTHALAEVPLLPPDERAPAVARAGVLVRRHADELDRLWGGGPLHPELADLVGDARRAVDAARSLGEPGQPSHGDAPGGS